MTTEDRRRGKLLPTPVTPPDFVCFTIIVPNAVQYRAALMGQLSILGEWHTWDHPIDGTVCEDCEEAAQLWRTAIAQSYFSEECEGMDCLALANCLQNNTSVRNIIQQMITQQAAPTYIYPPGQPLTPQQYNAPLNPVPAGCDLDVFWAQMTQFVQYFTQAGTDFIEKLIVYMNAVEGAQFIEMAPVLGTIVDEVQLDKALQFFAWVLDTINELYQGALTDLLKEEIACAYFCAGKADCTITIERIWQVENERLGGILAPTEIDTLEELIDAALTLGSNPGLAVDIWLTVLAGLAKFAGYLGVRGIDETLAIVLRLAENDANNDWEILCTECAEPTEEYTPEIGTWLDTSGGTLSGPDSEGYYTVTATWTGFDWRGAIQEAAGKTFKLANVSYPSGGSACQVFERADESVYVGCGFINQYANEGNPPINTIVWTWDAARSVRFQMVAP